MATLAVLALGTGCAAAAADRYPITPEQRQIAERTASTGVALSDLAPGAPASYTVKRGDTLWSIATLFLKSPWRWPELWGMNQAQIQNPHLIYPAQTISVVKTADGRVRLSIGGSEPPAPEPAPAPATAPAPAPAAATAAAPEKVEPVVPTVKLQPRARDTAAEAAAAIPSIPNNLIDPFLSEPMVVAAEELDSAPRIVATPQDRVFLGIGDSAYVRGITDDKVESYHVFRPATPLYDPDDATRSRPIAYEAMYLGAARITHRGEVTTLAITESKQEIGVGDRLVPITHQELVTYAPRPPTKPVEGRIVSVYGGVASIGSGSIVTVNRGQGDGLAIGTVLAILRNGNTISDRTAGHEKVKLPDEGVGHVFIFRVFDKVAYGLLVSASGPIQVGDRVASPDAVPFDPVAH